jgi:hypothetical protein
MSRHVLVIALLLAAGSAHADWFDGRDFGWYGRLYGSRVPLAGRDLNGIAMNGLVLDGRSVSHVSLAGGSLNGAPLTDLELEATEFRGRAGRRPVRGAALAGAELDAALAGGGTVRLRIDDVARGRGRSDRDVTRYLVSYRTRQGWAPLCGTDASGAPVGAIPLSGRWVESGDHVDDAGAFTFACTGFVLAHCVDAGYAPWREAAVCSRPGRCQRITLAAHHQACTRMMRADYCGDGASHTVDHTPVNAYDPLGVRFDSEDWAFEAEWDEDGARCLVNERLPGVVPACAEALVDPDCGDPAHATEGALIFSEVQPAP